MAKKVSGQEKVSAASEITRKFKQSPALYIGSVVILVLVTVTFIGGDLLSGGAGGRGGDLTFGYYDNIPISWVPGNMFSQYYENAVRFYQSQGFSLDNFQVAAQVWRQAYEAAVVHSAVLQIMNRSNYSVPERVVNRNVAQLPHFQDNGRFSPALYRQMSDAARANLWRQTQDELTKIMFYRDFFSLLVPNGEINFIADMASPMRSFEMVSFRIDSFPDTEYLSFALDNEELFNTIHLSMISVRTEREARRILDSIRNGTTTFEEAARSQSQDGYADRGGDIGTRYVFELDHDIPNHAARQIVFGMNTGELSDIVNLGDAWAIFRIENRLTAPDFDDASVMDRVRTYVRSFQRGRMEDWAISQARDFILEAQEFGFDNVTRWRNLERNSFGPLPVNFGGIDLFTSLESFSASFSNFGLNAQDVSRNENFWRIAFSTDLNTLSEPMVQGGNVLVFYPIEQIDTEDSFIENIAAMYENHWLDSITEQSLQLYFLNNERMDDRFWDTYFRVFMPSF
jgi:hypothetical protein